MESDEIDPIGFAPSFERSDRIRPNLNGTDPIGPDVAIRIDEVLITDAPAFPLRWKQRRPSDARSRVQQNWPCRQIDGAASRYSAAWSAPAAEFRRAEEPVAAPRPIWK